MKKILIAVTIGLALVACGKKASAETLIGSRVCTEVTRPDGSKALSCRNVVQDPADTPGVPTPTVENKGVKAEANAAATSASTANSTASTNATQSLSTADNSKDLTVTFAPPASTIVPQATSICSQTKSSAVSLLVISWSSSDQYTSKFCGYMHLYSTYVTMGLFSKAAEMLEKAEKSLD